MTSSVPSPGAPTPPDGGRVALMPDVDLSELDSLDDGRRHLWCGTCHPDWASRPFGAELGAPFTAWCGVRAVILVPSPLDLPADSCPSCAEPSRACPKCGAR